MNCFFLAVRCVALFRFRGNQFLTVLLCEQGIDLKAGGRNKKTKRTAPKSQNVYLKLLVKVHL